MTINEQFKEYGVVPVVVLNDAKDALPLAKALVEGGLACAEVTFRTDAAEESIRLMSEAYPEMLVGAGTVLTIDQVNRAVKAGAKFIVSPGFDPEIVDYCLENNIPVLPGCITPSEVAQAVKRGLKVVKFFPAEQSGGIAAIRAICGPYKGIQFMSTGGLNLDNIADYFAFDRIACCGGTYMLGKHLAAKQWDEITALCKKSVQTMLGLKLAHIGVNEPDEQAAYADAAAFNDLLVLDAGNNSVNIFLRGYSLFLCYIHYLLTVLVRSGQEHHVVAGQALVARHRVGRHRAVGVADVQLVRRVVNGRGDIESFLFHGYLPLFLPAPNESGA